jgi:hypothetical protein
MYIPVYLSSLSAVGFFVLLCSKILALISARRTKHKMDMTEETNIFLYAVNRH